MKTRVIESNITPAEKRDLLHRLGQSVKEARENKGLTQLSLSLETGLSKAFLSDLECGRRNPSFETLCRLAKALQIDLGKLLDLPADENQSK